MSDEACLYQQLLCSFLWQDDQNNPLVSECSLEQVNRYAAAVNKFLTIHFHVVFIKVKFSEKLDNFLLHLAIVGFLSGLGSFPAQTLKAAQCFLFCLMQHVSNSAAFVKEPVTILSLATFMTVFSATSS